MYDMTSRYAVKAFRLFCITLLAVGCTKQTPVTPEKPSSPSELMQHAEFHRNAATFSRKDMAPGLDVTGYSLKGNFDWSRNRLIAEVAVRFNLDASQKMLILNSSVAEVHSVKLFTGAALPYTIASDLLQVDLSSLTSKERQGEIQVTIAYEGDANALPNGEPSAITSVPARAGDPVKSRVVYTTSEPLGADNWMPCHNVPSDRALFSSEFTMPASETLISNGDLKLNQVASGVRTMKYETKYSLPSYLMAFAVGEFTTATAYHNGLPVSMWARKGLTADFQGMLNATIHAIAHYESLLIPYPFEKYAIVLLPEFPAGGVEHASITFQAENRTTQSVLSSDTGLMQHELGHQWFGDFVTVEGWDDLWIKEGMATLLAEESSRDVEDENGTNRLFGRNFGVSEGDAIRDPSLAPDDKYTSGPYGRSAWLLTQIRSLVGETKFWGTLQSVLNNHAFGNISTEQMVAAFEPLLPAGMSDKIFAALAAKAMPSLEVTQNNGIWSLSLSDAEHAMIAPLELSWLSAGSAPKNASVEPGASVSLASVPGEMLALDPRDVHALSSFKYDVKKFIPSVLALSVPKTTEQRKLYFAAPANVQLFGLQASEAWDLEPQDIAGFIRSFSSEEARYLALETVCNVAKRKSSVTGTGPWQAPITHELFKPSFPGLPGSLSGTALSVCGQLAEPGLFTTQWRSVAANPGGAEFSEPQAFYLSLFDGPSEEAFQTWSSLSDGGASVRSRLIGLSALSRHLSGFGFSIPTAAELPAWKAFFRHILQDSDVSEMQTIAVGALRRMKDTDAFTQFMAVAQSTRRPTLQTSVVCAAYGIAGTDAAKWDSFVKGFGAQSSLNAHLAGLLQNPKQTCGG